MVHLVAFVQKADPWSQPRLGALLEDGFTLVDVQAAHFAMYDAPHPHLHDLEAFHAGMPRSGEVVREVVEWVRSQQPPGTTTRMDAVRPLGNAEPLAWT